MSTPVPNPTPTPAPTPVPGRHTAETKSALKTTELIVLVLCSVGIFIASAVVDINEDGQGFGAARAWFYVTLLCVGYMVSRGLAKSGHRDHYDV